MIIVVLIANVDTTEEEEQHRKRVPNLATESVNGWEGLSRTRICQFTAS